MVKSTSDVEEKNSTTRPSDILRLRGKNIIYVFDGEATTVHGVNDRMGPTPWRADLDID